MSDDDLLVVGRAACEVSPRMTREGAVEYLADTTTRGNRETAEILVASAHNELCPAAVFSQGPATPALTTPSQASPLTTFGSGTYGVGVDVAPGKYRTPGADNCYWARLKENNGAVGDIIDNFLGSGPQVVTIHAGKYFETQGCGTWRAQ